MTETRAPYIGDGISLCLFVTGVPVPKQSTRFANGHCFTPPRVAAWHDTVSFAAKLAAARDRWNCTDAPVRVSLLFCLPNRRRVDVDNLSKNVLDALRGIAFDDDNQVIDLHIRKIYAAKDEPVGVLIEVLEATQE